MSDGALTTVLDPPIKITVGFHPEVGILEPASLMFNAGETIKLTGAGSYATSSCVPGMQSKDFGHIGLDFSLNNDVVIIGTLEECVAACMGECKAFSWLMTADPLQLGGGAARGRRRRPRLHGGGPAPVFAAQLTAQLRPDVDHGDCVVNPGLTFLEAEVGLDTPRLPYVGFAVWLARNT